MQPKLITFQYQFTFSDGRIKRYGVTLDAKTLNLVSPAKSSYPEWTRLTYHQCPNCPLKEKDSPECPVAASLLDIVEDLKAAVSCEEVEVEVTTPYRQYRRKTSLQLALSSLMGVVMTTSGCPILGKLKPMVSTHLPFSSLQESTYRALTMYLLAQYFLMKRGQNPDWEMKELAKLFEDIRLVNQSLLKRIACVQIQEANLNAILHLDCYAHFTNITLLEKGLDDIEELFAPYFTAAPLNQRPVTKTITPPPPC